MAYWNDYGYRSYVSVAARRQQALRKMKHLEKGGRRIEPVELDGKKIAHTFWGKSWCENLEAYSDYANRMPRGRAYVRNGSVIDLQIAKGRVTALVSGLEIYEIEVDIHPLAPAHWKALVQASSGEMLSMVDLLSGKFSEQVMRRFCDRGHGLFPEPSEIELTCSCPDWAGMCKHVAATLYGVGSRLDARPELLFTLRGVDPLDLVHAAATTPAKARAPSGGRVLDRSGLDAIFGIEMGHVPQAKAKASREKPARALSPKRPKRRAPARGAPNRPQAIR